MTNKEIEAAAEEYDNQCYRMEPWKEPTIKNAFIDGAAHMQPKIAELEGKLEIALRTLDSISYSEQGTIQQITAQMAIKKIREFNYQKIREGEK